MSCQKILAICGSSGVIGSHPLDIDCWSGSSARFFGEIQKRGVLFGAVGGEIPVWEKAFYAMLNVTTDKKLLARKTYMDPRYRNALSRVLNRKIQAQSFDLCDVVSIQLGSMYNLSDVLRPCALRTSYNDGNFCVSFQSPYFPKEISKQAIEATFRFEKRVLDGLDTIFTMSEYLKKSFINDYGQPEEKVACIGAGVNLDIDMRSLQNDPVAQKKYDTKQILFIGVDFFRKGGETLVKAFHTVRKKYADAKLVIVGPHSLPVAYKNEPGIFYVGFLDKTTSEGNRILKRLFAESSLFVMPSLYEPFGIAPLEAMLHHLPCLVSDCWALPEIVPSGKHGELVEPGNETALAEKLIHLLGSPDLLYRYGATARDWVLENFLWPKVVDRLEAFVNSKMLPVNTMDRI